MMISYPSETQKSFFSKSQKQDGISTKFFFLTYLFIQLSVTDYIPLLFCTALATDWAQLETLTQDEVVKIFPRL